MAKEVQVHSNHRGPLSIPRCATEWEIGPETFSVAIELSQTVILNAESRFWNVSHLYHSSLSHTPSDSWQSLDSPAVSTEHTIQLTDYSPLYRRQQCHYTCTDFSCGIFISSTIILPPYRNSNSDGIEAF